VTREELEALGMTDAQLEEQCQKVIGAAPKLAGKPDTAWMQRVRRNWFDELAKWEKGGIAEINPKGPRIGSFGENDPDAHFGPGGPPKAPPED
jgi:hypothetical protein